MDHYSGINELEILKYAKNYNRHLTQRVGNTFSQNNQLLDFGAGIGTFADSLKGQGFNIDCIEIDQTLSSALKEKGYRVYQSINELDESGHSQIYSLNVLEHIEDDQQVLKDLYNFLPKEGKIYLFLPAFNILYSSFDKSVGHYRRYHKEEIIQKLKKAGFQINFCRYVDSMGFLAAYLFKLLDKQGSFNPVTVKIFDRFIFPISLICDKIFSPFFGKNVEALAIKKD